MPSSPPVGGEEAQTYVFLAPFCRSNAKHPFFSVLFRPTREGISSRVPRNRSLAAPDIDCIEYPRRPRFADGFLQLPYNREE